MLMAILFNDFLQNKTSNYFVSCSRSTFGISAVQKN